MQRNGKPLNDEQLRLLNNLFNDALASGLTRKKALELLESEFAKPEYKACFYFPSRGFAMTDSACVLLADRSCARGSPQTEAISISGSGRHYNGMWGDVSMLASMVGDEGFAEVLRSIDRKPAPVCEQVVCCVSMLSRHQTSLHPGLAAAARRHLSELLLTYPVLLHPAVMLPSGPDGELFYAPLVYLLARSTHGGLPRYSHFEPDDGSQPLHRMPNQALVRRLTEFANHPCLVLGLTRAGLRVSFNEKTQKFLTRKESLFTAMSEVIHGRSQFIASVMELEELASPLGPNRTRAAPFHRTATTELARECVVRSLANAMCSASAMVHLAPSSHTPGYPSREIRTYAADSRLLASIRERMPARCGRDKEGSQFGQALRDLVLRKIFLRSEIGLSPDELVYNTRQFVRGLMDCGFCSTSQEAAHFIATTLLGYDRPGVNLPRTETAHAVLFLKAIDEMGGFNLHGEGDEASILGMRSLLGAVREFPRRDRLPYRDLWESAFNVVVTEKVMRSAMAHATPQMNHTATQVANSSESTAVVVAQELPDVGAARHRARTSI